VGMGGEPNKKDIYVVLGVKDISGVLKNE